MASEHMTSSMVQVNRLNPAALRVPLCDLCAISSSSLVSVFTMTVQPLTETSASHMRLFVGLVGSWWGGIYTLWMAPNLQSECTKGPL